MNIDSQPEMIAIENTRNEQDEQITRATAGLAEILNDLEIDK